MDGEAFCPRRGSLKSWHLLTDAPPSTGREHLGFSLSFAYMRLFMPSATPIIGNVTVREVDFLPDTLTWCLKGADCVGGPAVSGRVSQ